MNLLVDPVFRVETPDGQQSMSLPALLAALGEDRVEALSGLQRHQEDAFHIFLCYLAGAVLARTGEENPVQVEAFWREGIRRLTGRQDDYAWMLVLEDVTQPAFMQAPLVDKSLFAKFNTKEPKARTPDELDLLATAKNHDCKQAQSAQPAIDDWIYALVSLQTSTCYGGRGNYGIARINGTSARPCVQIMDSDRYGLRWQQDVTRLLRYRPKLLNQDHPYDALGIVLTWVPPWDLKTSLALDALDPFFIEISRAIRLVMTDSGIRVLGAASEPRVIAKAQRDKLKGNLGDPWTPINRNEIAKAQRDELKGDLGDPWTPINHNKNKSGSAVVLGKNCLTPRVLHDLLFAEIDRVSPFKPCAFMQQDTGAAPTPALFHVTALARRGGMDCSTEGFHAADIPIPGKVKLSLMRRDTEAERLGKVSRERLNDASVMENKVLNPALLALLEGGPEKIDYDKRELNAWRERAIQTYAEAWAADFFPWLWRTLDEVDADAARLAWLRSLQDKAWRAFQGAIERYPARSGRRYRARVRAEGVFRGALYTHFPQLKEEQRVTN